MNSLANNELNHESYRCISDTKERMVGVIAQARNGANAIPIFSRPSVFLSTERKSIVDAINVPPTPSQDLAAARMQLCL